MASAKSGTAKKTAKSKSVAKPAKATALPRATVKKFSWSSEGGWETRVPGSLLRERLGAALENQSKSAREFLSTLPSDPVARVTEVMGLVDRANEGAIKKTDLDVKLALAWGSAVREGLGWESIEVRDKAGRIGTGLVTDPDRRWTVDPRALMRRLLGLAPNRRCDDNTALLLYNMIAAGNLPPAKSGDYLRIG